MTEGLFSGSRRVVMFALMSTVGIASYNNLSAVAALPDIGDDLGRIELLPWVITIELLTAAVAVLAAGPVIDSIGARRTFRVAVVGFMITSLLVGVAPTMQALLAARAIQGVFAGALITVAMAGIGLAVPKKQLPRAFAATSAVWGIMGVTGPAIAAVLLTTVGWRGIFFVNIPVALLAAASGWNVLPDRQDDAKSSPIDLVGLALIAAVTGGALSLASAELVPIVGGGLVVTVAAPLYVAWSRRTPDPVVRLPHLFDRRYRTVHLTSMAVLAGGIGTESFLPLYMKGVRGSSSAAAAFSVLFLTVGWTTSAFVSSRLQDRWAGEWVSLLGSLMAFPAIVATALAIQFDAPLAAVFSAFFMLGAGVGMVTSTGSALLQSRTASGEMGRLNGAHQFLRTVAMTFGIAIVGAITLAVVNARTGSVESVRALLSDDGTIVSQDALEALADGYAIAVGVVAVIVAGSIPSAIRLVRTRGEQLLSSP